MSPTTKTSGWEASEQSGVTVTRPARSVGDPVASAISSANGAARTPAAQIVVIAGIVRCSPSPSRTEIVSASSPLTVVRT